MLTPRVPLAWLNLVHDKRRLVVSIAGVTFAVLLMFMQVGFRNALFDSTISLIRQFDADFVVISKSKYCLVVNSPFSRRRLDQALALPGIASATAVYLEYRSSLWKDTTERHSKQRPIRVIAFDPDLSAMLLPEVIAQQARLLEPDSALIDLRTKKQYGTIKEDIDRELAGRDIHIAGTFALGTDFTCDGNLVMSDRNFAKYFPVGPSADDTLSRVEIGLLKTTAQSNPAQLQATLQDELGREDVIVLTKQEFVERERDYWQKHTPIGFIFGMGTIIGFVVGMVICYQILSSDVADHLAEFATLKAIGYANSYLTNLMLQEALWLSLFGFLPGFAVAWMLYALLGWQTGLPMLLTWERVGLILGLTVTMCVLSGVLALRKVQAADPAEVF